MDGLAAAASETWLDLAEGWVADYPDLNAAAAYGDVACSNFSQDATPPYLVSFELDLDAGTLCLVADEPVRAASANLSSFQLAQASENLEEDEDDDERVALDAFSEVVPDVVDGTRMTFTLHWESLDSVKIAAELGADASTTWLSHQLRFQAVVGAGLVDMALNALQEINASSAIACSLRVRSASPTTRATRFFKNIFRFEFP